MKLQITRIDVEFSKGSFAEWANGMEDQLEEDVDRWESAYNEEITKAIQEMYPNAKIEVGEGYDQLSSTKTYVELKEVKSGADYEDTNADEDIYHMEIEEDVKLQIDYILSAVADDGKFWEA